MRGVAMATRLQDRVTVLEREVWALKAKIQTTKMPVEAIHQDVKSIPELPTLQFRLDNNSVLSRRGREGRHANRV
jgi:hypothetical protein